MSKDTLELLAFWQVEHDESSQSNLALPQGTAETTDERGIVTLQSFWQGEGSVSPQSESPAAEGEARTIAAEGIAAEGIVALQSFWQGDSSLSPQTATLSVSSASQPAASADATGEFLTRLGATPDSDGSLSPQGATPSSGDAGADGGETSSSKPDDLKTIEGIGPKISELLIEEGITSFAQLADTKIDKLNHILQEASLKMVDPSTWPEQAKLAAKGKKKELEALQDKLRAGRSS